jgi:hypothetical protein
MFELRGIEDESPKSPSEISPIKTSPMREREEHDWDNF